MKEWYDPKLTVTQDQLLRLSWGKTVTLELKVTGLSSIVQCVSEVIFPPTIVPRTSTLTKNSTLNRKIRARMMQTKRLNIDTS